MKILKCFALLVLFGINQTIWSQEIPSNAIIPNDQLSSYLKEEIKNSFGDKTVSKTDLAKYFRTKFSERYFFDWQTFDSRFNNYKLIYPEVESSHTERALDHISKFQDSTSWKLPFNYLNGEPVNAYALRHLARQHKMLDIAFYYNYQNKSPEYLNYFKNQLKSLNHALHTNAFETIEDGNGVYEAFRSGYRILNWLNIHNMFLGESNYSDEDQLLTIATLLQHGSDLYAKNEAFVSGNHQTRGMSALAMLSILLRDFKGTDKWFERSMSLLEAHLEKEINDDGFQFERTVHYHMSDIDNYYYVYQLAKNSDIKVNGFWESKLKSLFTTLTKIAYPDKSAPVLSDDTNEPWAEKMDISGALTLGYLLFEDPEMGYFANNFVEPKMFWYVSASQLKLLDNINAKEPEVQSFSFPTTGYFIMREGWKPKDKVMVISNGLDDEKPDHQHGDMLGIQAMANGHTILPNYQVRYSLKDYGFFKNSLVKNVALVDNELQGKAYTSNQGGSGFGKFKSLPQPKTIAWNNNNDLDLYIGSHDGFENVGVNYSRQVIYLKDDFWIIKDNFNSEKPHTYKQIWQGHYSLEEAPNLLRSSFFDGSGCDIYQLISTDSVSTSGRRGKQWATVSKNNQTNFNFISVVFPFVKFDDRIDEDKSSPNLKGWELNKSNWTTDSTLSLSLTKDGKSVFFSVKNLKFKELKISFSEAADVFLKLENSKLYIQSLNTKPIQAEVLGFNNKGKTLLAPGNEISFIIKK
ncbi:heparinase II/III family protein [Sabulilitoribacter multivorans]|uniref:Heparinase II/III family protein n=1 Tax=Flaviramulus multivorans TaxID=1304750 RepID=A0ABS9IIP0_9FLAO|nr:heparinase II/III family protein [Flaviramulus multivorans]MCF7560626.1 heparinase II/III family protein [Flaviramulus multivorans]